jgi:hypothetical protein
VPDGGALPQHASRRSRRSSSPQPARRIDRYARAQALFVSLPRRRGDRCCHRGARASASCSAFERVDESEIVVTLDCRRKPPCAHRQNANVGGRELRLRCSRSHDAADLPLRPPRGERCNGCAGPKRIIDAAGYGSICRDRCAKRVRPPQHCNAGRNRSTFNRAESARIGHYGYTIICVLFITLPIFFRMTLVRH